MDNYGQEEQISTKAEKAGMLPIYVARKILLATGLLALLWLTFISKPFRFRLDYEFGDRDGWKWFTGYSLPRLKVEKDGEIRIGGKKH